MLLPILVLLVSVSGLLFYLHEVSSQALRRKFDKPYFQALAAANHWEFPHLREVLESAGSQADYTRIRLTLKCEFQALTFLLKLNATNRRFRYSREELLLIFYYRLIFFSLGVRQALGLQMKSAALKLTAILQYFANALGQRVELVCMEKVVPSNYAI